MASVTTSGPDGTHTAGYTYDETGNTATRPGETFEWDAEGRLASVTRDGARTSFVYTADGERLLKRDPGGLTLYLANQEVRLVSGSSTPTGSRYYTLGGDLVAVRQGGSLTWLATDHQGTPQVAVDSATLEVTRRRQDPFGVPRAPAPATWPGEKGFVGGEQDTSTGLTHLGAREYDPALGRFLSLDPVLPLSDPQQMHGYSYATNNPVTFADPTGLWIPETDSGGWIDSQAVPDPGEPYQTPGGAVRPPGVDALGQFKKANDVMSALLGGSLKMDDLAKYVRAAIRDGKVTLTDFVTATARGTWYGKLGDVLDKKVYRGLARASAMLGPYLSYVDYRRNGDAPHVAGIKASIESGFSWLGAAAGGAGGGAIGLTGGPVTGVFGAMAGSAVGAYAGNWIGGQVAKFGDQGLDDSWRNMGRAYSVVEDVGLEVVTGDGIGVDDVADTAAGLTGALLGW